MSVTVDIEVRGLIETQRNLEKAMRNLRGDPVVQAFRDATLMVQRDAKLAAPVDTGRLRASITPEVTADTREVLGIVGSNVEYAPYMELGTRPHFPPVAALETWARRHHISAYLVARAIGKRGLKARRYLQGAFEKNRERIIRRIERGVQEAINK